MTTSHWSMRGRHQEQRVRERDHARQKNSLKLGWKFFTKINFNSNHNQIWLHQNQIKNDFDWNLMWFFPIILKWLSPITIKFWLIEKNLIWLHFDVIFSNHFKMIDWQTLIVIDFAWTLIFKNNFKALQ